MSSPPASETGPGKPDENKGTVPKGPPATPTAESPSTTNKDEEEEEEDKLKKITETDTHIITEITTVEIPTGEEATLQELLDEEAALEPEAIGENKIEESKAWEAAEGADVEVVSEVESDEGNQRIYAQEYVRSFKPFIIYSRLLGRFPFAFIRNDFGFFQVTFTNSSIFGLLFTLTCFAHFLTLLLVLIGLASLLLNAPRAAGQGVTGTGTDSDEWRVRAEELFIFRRNAAPLIAFLSSLIHICVADYHLLHKKKVVAAYFNFWTEALQIMKVHAGAGVFSSMTAILFVSLLFTFFFSALVVFPLAPVVSGAGAFIAMLFCRAIKSDIHSTEYFEPLRLLGTAVFGYVLFSGKIYALLFIFHCKIIRNAFHLWNQRLDVVLNRTDDFIVRGNRLGKRTGFQELFKDHVVLLDLLDGADTLFAEIMESFFTCEVASYCIQLYYVYRTFTESGPGAEFEEARKLDALPATAMLLNSTILVALIAANVSGVSEKTMDGLEIIRRKGFFGRKSPEELYFLLSLYTSYNGHFETAISGSGYYTFNREFLLSFAGSFLAYMVILLQFSPSLEQTDPGLNARILGDGVKTGRAVLLEKVENTIGFFDDYRVGFLGLGDEETDYWPDFVV